mmetsp:Transcript_29625/g.34221  ORF Transcript_29625/g.34221 Transcript_29625/m.34221 type:complete len:259 (+) Transcript_29625:50-826(+)
MLQHQFNWMGSARHETATAVLVSLRDGAEYCEGSLRNRDYQQRRHVAELVRERLSRIKEELGLVAASPDERENPATDTSLFPTPQKLQSAKDLAASVRTMLVSHGEAFISYIDGSPHRDINALQCFNEKARQAISSDQALARALPSEEQFDISSLEQAIAKESVIRKRLDAARLSQDPNYLTTFALPEGKNLEALIAEEEEKIVSQQTLEDLEKEYQAARSVTKQVKSEFNTKAAEASKSLVLIAGIRAISTKLHSTK